MNKTYKINYNQFASNGNTEKVSGPMSFYHLKKEGEKNIYLFGDRHGRYDNICNIE